MPAGTAKEEASSNDCPVGDGVPDVPPENAQHFSGNRTEPLLRSRVVEDADPYIPLVDRSMRTMPHGLEGHYFLWASIFSASSVRYIHRSVLYSSLASRSVSSSWSCCSFTKSAPQESWAA